jgi:hypothetical protein
MNVELSERDKDTDKQKRRKSIKESKYNRKYERCMVYDRKFRSRVLRLRRSATKQNWVVKVKERNRRNQNVCCERYKACLSLPPHTVRVWGFCGLLGTSTGGAPKMCTWSSGAEWWSEGPYNSRLFRQPNVELGGRIACLLPGWCGTSKGM